MATNDDKNIALVLAGGLGNRMGSSMDLPKQFYKLTDKPVIIHTLEIFQNHPEIDAICIVCIETWERYLRGCIDNFGITKVQCIVPGGNTRHESVEHGLNALKSLANPDDIVVVHDGVRPFITPGLVSTCLQHTREHGSAMTSIRSSDSLLQSDGSMTSSHALERDSIFLVQTPQCYRYQRGIGAYEEARSKGIANSINCCELFVTLGQNVHLVPGIKTNVKLTTSDDIAFLHALHAIYTKNNE